MQTIYWVEWLAVIILIGLSYHFEEKIIFKQLAYIITSLRSLVRLFDFEDSQYVNKAGEKTVFYLDQEFNGRIVAMNSDFILTLVYVSNYSLVSLILGCLLFPQTI